MAMGELVTNVPFSPLSPNLARRRSPASLRSRSSRSTGVSPGGGRLAAGAAERPEDAEDAEVRGSASFVGGLRPSRRARILHTTNSAAR